jgi:hypothetical protein
MSVFTTADVATRMHREHLDRAAARRHARHARPAATVPASRRSIAAWLRVPDDCEASGRAIVPVPSR